MKIACLTFTRQGQQIAARIQAGFPENVDVFTTNTYKPHLPRIFEEYNGIVFIASTGIAVRLSLPFLRDKTADPAIVVVDDLGQYAISLVSGHLGGANALAQKIAEILDCQPIITTASDGRGIEAVDLFAQKHHLVIENLHDAKTITAMMVEGQPITLISEIATSLNYPHLVEENPAGCIYVTSQAQIACDTPYCMLRPKNLHLGIGCRKGKTKDEILNAIENVFEQHNLSLKSIKVIATGEVKKYEAGILETCDALNAELKIFTNDEIHTVQEQFSKSAFVQSMIGVSAVCEPCAYLSGGEIIVGKRAVNGITIAVAKEI